MQHVAWYRGIEICRTSAGHLVVLDPGEDWQDRARLVELLATADALDSLFFPTIAEARETIDEFIAHGLVG